jgi:predicted DNA repair protein MutK
MLWVAGHILLVGVDELGAGTALYDAVHHVEEARRTTRPPLGEGCSAGSSTTLARAAVGAVVGRSSVALQTLVRRARGKETRQRTDSAADGPLELGDGVHRVGSVPAASAR